VTRYEDRLRAQAGVAITVGYIPWNALADAVRVLHHIATFQAETESDGEIVALLQDQAQQAMAGLDALAATDAKQPSPSVSGSGSSAGVSE
jgi:hypothetical protein